MPTSVALSPRLETFVREQVEGGRYNNVSEVVRDGLRLLEQRQQEDAAKLDALRRAVATGVADIDEGRFTVIDPDHIAATIAGLGESAVKRSARRRAVPKRSSAR
jgi:putative addiction module CopG family antidote